MQIKTVNTNGQIALGTRYAGQNVVIDEVESGVWIIKVGNFVPRSEAWLYDPDVAQLLDQAVQWSDTHPRQATDLEALERRLAHDDSTPRSE